MINITLTKFPATFLFCTRLYVEWKTKENKKFPDSIFYKRFWATMKI